MGSFSIWHWLVVLVIVMLVFGTKRVPNIMNDLAKGIRSFREGLKEDDKKLPSSSEAVGQNKLPPPDDKQP